MLNSHLAYAYRPPLGSTSCLLGGDQGGGDTSPPPRPFSYTIPFLQELRAMAESTPIDSACSLVLRVHTICRLLLALNYLSGNYPSTRELFLSLSLCLLLNAEHSLRKTLHHFPAHQALCHMLNYHLQCNVGYLQELA